MLQQSIAHEVTRVRPSGNAAAWRYASLAVGLVFALLLMYWQMRDKTPPRWDEGQYLLNAWAEWSAAKGSGLAGFYRAFLATDPGRPGLVALLAVPGFLLFKQSLEVAMFPFAILWILAAWSIHDFTFNAGRLLLGLDRRQSSIAGFFAFAFFSVFPLTQYQSHLFLVEFPLIVSIAVLNACAMRYWADGRLIWGAAAGAALAAGLLAKVTLPAFALAAVGLIVWRLYLDRSLVVVCKAVCIIALPVLLIAAPFYLINLHVIIDVTRFLASADVASVYGLGGGMRLGPTLDFLLTMTREYEFMICVLLASIFVLIVLIGSRGNQKGSRTAVVLIAASTAVPLFIVALSEFKLARYAYPGFLGLFVLAGYGLSLVWRGNWAVATLVSALLFFLPTVKTGVTHDLIPAGFMARAATLQARLDLQGWAILDYAPPPDPRNWQVDKLVDATRDDGDRPGIVVIVGGSPAFHQALFRFTSLTMGLDQNYIGFPFQLYPHLVANDLLKFVESAMPSTVLYKSPPYDPPHLGQYAEDVVRFLSDSSRYTRRDLPFVQPDGSRFALYSPLHPPVEVLQRNGSGEGAPRSTIYNFSDRYGLESVDFTDERFGVIASLTWRRLGDPLPNEHIIFHLVDENGNLVATFDRRICAGCAASVNVLRWTESVYLDKTQLRGRTRLRIGIGVYGPGSAPPLKGSGGPADWEGARALFDLPAGIN